MVRCRQIYYKQLQMLALKLILQILQPSLDFPGHPVIKTLPSNAVGVGSIPGQGLLFNHILDFPGGSDGKASAYNAGNLGSIPRLGRSPGEGNGNPLQYSCLEIPWTEEPGRLQSMGSQRVRHD